MFAPNKDALLKKDAKLALYLARLMSCAFGGIGVDDIPEGLTWREVFEASGWNSITGLTWLAIRDLPLVPVNVRDEWERSACSTVFRRLQFDAERELIIEQLIERGIDVMPLKGAVIAPLYPSLEMRSMYDNDVLYGYVEQGVDGCWHIKGDNCEACRHSVNEARDTVAEVMNELGYVVVDPLPTEQCHDTKFVKAPHLVFEMHHALMGNEDMDRGFFSEPWRFACLETTNSNWVDGKGRRYVLPPEETYLHSIAHAYKHSINGYIGLRTLADEWVLLSAYAKSMDWTHVNEMLDNAGIASFEASLRNLTTKVFEREKLTRNELRELVHMTKAGTYGTPEDHVRNYVQNRRKAGDRCPRLAFLVSLLCSGNAPKSGPLADIAASRVLRHLYPAAKLAILLGRIIKSPKAMGAKILALISGSMGRG